MNKRYRATEGNPQNILLELSKIIKRDDWSKASKVLGEHDWSYIDSMISEESRRDNLDSISIEDGYGGYYNDERIGKHSILDEEFGYVIMQDGKAGIWFRGEYRKEICMYHQNLENKLAEIESELGWAA